MTYPLGTSADHGRAQCIQVCLAVTLGSYDFLVITPVSCELLAITLVSCEHGIFCARAMLGCHVRPQMVTHEQRHLFRALSGIQRMPIERPTETLAFVSHFGL